MDCLYYFWCSTSFVVRPQQALGTPLPSGDLLFNSARSKLESTAAKAMPKAAKVLPTGAKARLSFGQSDPEQPERKQLDNECMRRFIDEPDAQSLAANDAQVTSCYFLGTLCR